MIQLTNPPSNITVDLPRPHSAQIKIIHESKRFNVLCCGRRFGKSQLGIDRAILKMLAGKRIGWFAPIDKVLDDAWELFKDLLEPVMIHKDENKKRIKVIGGGRLEMWTMEAKLVARSRKYHEVFLDEAAKIDNLRERFNKEIRPTLSDYQGGAWFLSTPDGDGDFKEMYDRWEVNQEPEWMSWHMPTWENPFIPKAEIEAVKKELPEIVFDQEYGALFIASTNNFVQPGWVDACALYGDQFPKLDPASPICVGIDAASKSDTFAIVGVGREYGTSRFITAFTRIFHPAELRDELTSIVTFRKPKEFIREIARTRHVVCFAYDPYQLVDTAGELYSEGVGFFDEFPQTTKRALADRHFYGLIRDQQWVFQGAEHSELAQHVKNANSKIAEGDKLRIIKRTDDKKIDACVAASMACYAITEFNL